MTVEAASTTTRTEEVYILYGSQSGSTEKAAQAFGEEMTDKLNPESLEALAGKKADVKLVPTVMKLDEFLELKEAQWTRLIVIFVSSYGAGEAPLGAKKFRELCNALVKQYEHQHKPSADLPLTGLHYALCGFGQFNFKTYMENPNITDRGLRAAGSTRLGPICRADSRGEGEHSQENSVKRWKEEMWQPLAEFLVQEPISDQALKEMHEKTAAIQY